MGLGNATEVARIWSSPAPSAQSHRLTAPPLSKKAAELVAGGCWNNAGSAVVSIVSKNFLLAVNSQASRKRPACG
jgi:hypothetical protein